MASAREAGGAQMAEGTLGLGEFEGLYGLSLGGDAKSEPAPAAEAGGGRGSSGADCAARRRAVRPAEPAAAAPGGARREGSGRAASSSESSAADSTRLTSLRCMRAVVGGACLRQG